MEEQFQVQNRDINSLSLKDIFYKYLRFLPLVVLSVALSLMIAYVYLRYSTPIYTATGSLIIKDDQPLKGGEKFDQVLAADNSKNIQNEIEVLKSRPLMVRVIDSLNLNFRYYAKGKIKELNVYKTCPFDIKAFHIYDSSETFNLTFHFLNENEFTINGEKTIFSIGQIFKNKYGIFTTTRRNNEPVSEFYTISWTPMFTIASMLSNELIVSPKSQGTGILLLTLNSDNPELAADVVNKTMNVYQLLTLEDKNQANEKTKEFIDKRLNVVSDELDSINKLRIAYMGSNNLIDPEIQATNYLSNISDVNKQINTINTQFELARIIEDYLKDKKNAFDPVPSSLGLQDITLNTLIAGYNATQLDRKSLLDANVPEGNILVKQNEGKIEKLRTNILENLQNIKNSYTATIQKLEVQSNSVQKQAKSIPSKQQVLEDIKIQQASKLAVYNYLREKREESAIALAAEIYGSKILDYAYVNNIPIKPNKTNIRLIAIFIGILLPALLIFILELLNDKITTRNDIEKLTDTTILGEIGHSNGLTNLVVTPNNRGIIAEQFRIIRSNLQYIITKISNPVILVTSSFSGEGKSFVSTNIGAVMALAGKKTIILEFDIRKPKILSQLHISKKPGLTNYILGKLKEEDLPIAVEGNDNLFVLGCGPIPPNPAELLLDTKLNELFIYLKANFDVIVMDTAPVGMVSDAMSLSKYADCTLYIVRQGHTYKKQIALIDEFHREGKLPKPSIILNDVKVHTGYGYYGYGKYGYGYGSGYFDEDVNGHSKMGKWFKWLDLKKWNKKASKQ